MEATALTPNLTMLRVDGWQVYVWRDGDSATVIDIGAPGSRRPYPASTESC
jgi:hypothetical protein